MDGTQAIIAEIIAEAEKSADSLTAAATAERDAMLGQVRADLVAMRETQLQKTRVEAEEIRGRRKTLSALEERKCLLSAKQKVLDGVYYSVVSKILNMTDHIYRAFIGDMIAKYAEDGDRIMVAERDAKRLHAQWVEELAAKLNKHLTLSEDYHKGRGGVLLIGKKYDKNLTLDTLAADLRAATEGAAAKKLFGTEN